MKKVLWLAALVFIVGITGAHAKTMSIATDEVNVRLKPHKDARVVYQASRGYPVQVIKRTQNWLLVKDWQKRQGWVYAENVSSTPTTVIKAETAKLRKGPGPKNASIAKAKQGEIYKVLECRNHWVKLGYYLDNEPAGWINGDMVWGY